MKELTLIFLLKDNEVLLAMKKRGFGEGKWNGIGGKVEANETTEEALVRETQEEIGVTPVTYKKVADITFDEIHEGERKLMHVNVFACTKWEGKPIESEEMRPQWFAQNEVPFQQMWSDDPFWLPKVLAGKVLTGKFTLSDSGEVIEYDVSEVSGF